jgi:hypothetical protein
MSGWQKTRAKGKLLRAMGLNLAGAFLGTRASNRTAYLGPANDKRNLTACWRLSFRLQMLMYPPGNEVNLGDELLGCSHMKRCSIGRR